MRSICTVEGCTRYLKGNGLCGTHYARFAKYGSTDLPKRPADMTLEEGVQHYLARCVKSGDCLVGPVTGDVYGEVRWGAGNRMAAHRAVYIATNGAVPDEMVIRHRCDNKPCANIDHLEVGTPAQNSRDIFDRKRHHNKWLRGEAHQCAKLTEALVCELRTVAAAGADLQEMASSYGLNYLTMCAAIRGRTWADAAVPPVPGFRRRPSNRKVSDLEPDRCAEAGRLADMGLSLAAIAAQMGTTRHTAFKMVRSVRQVAS